jgi:hypothetical protein
MGFYIFSCEWILDDGNSSSNLLCQTMETSLFSLLAATYPYPPDSCSNLQLALGVEDPKEVIGNLSLTRFHWTGPHQPHVQPLVPISICFPWSSRIRISATIRMMWQWKLIIFFFFFHYSIIWLLVSHLL